MDRSPKIIISASGMCEAGRIRHHLKHNLWDARSSVVFVGYQAEGTLGKLLVEGTKDITLFGEAVHVNAEIYNLEGFSGHADQNGLFAWISGFRKKPRQIFLVHGEEDSKKDFAKLISDKLGYDPVVVLENSEYELDMNTAEITHVEKLLEEGRKDDEIERLRTQLAKIHYQLENILYTTDLAVAPDISGDKLAKINNLVQELDKTTLVLGSAITEEDRSGEAAAEQVQTQEKR